MPTKSFEEDQIKRLKQPKFAALYLKSVIDDVMKDGDMSFLALALQDIIKAHGNISSIAEEADISRQHLHRLISGKTDNPTLMTFVSILKAVGLKIDILPLIESK